MNDGERDFNRCEAPEGEGGGRDVRSAPRSDAGASMESFGLGEEEERAPDDLEAMLLNE
jgi:hypothetical protein